MDAMATLQPSRPGPLRRERFLAAYVALAGIAVNLAMALANSRYWNVDFNQLYAAGKLVGTGHLYDWNAIQSLELQRLEHAVPFGRIPFFALAFHQLSALPFPVARILWLSVGLAAVAGFVALWPFPSRAWAAAAVCWSAPAAMCLALGQDSVLFLFFAALGLRLLLRGNHFWAGLAFSLCCAKPHLALLLPVLLAARRHWRALLGGLSGVAVMGAMSFLAEGWRWPARWLALSRIPEFDPAPDRMPNLRGLLGFFPHEVLLEVVLGIVLVMLIWQFGRWLPQAAAAWTLAGGLLISHHAYFYDAVLLLPALLVVFHEVRPGWIRNWSLVLLTPIPYLFLLTNLAWIGRLLIAGGTLALLGAAWFQLRTGRLQASG